MKLGQILFSFLLVSQAFALDHKTTESRPSCGLSEAHLRVDQKDSTITLTAFSGSQSEITFTLDHKQQLQVLPLVGKNVVAQIFLNQKLVGTNVPQINILSIDEKFANPLFPLEEYGFKTIKAEACQN